MIPPMKKKRPQKRPKDDIVIPPITASSFEEAVSRLLKIKPPEKPAKKAAKKR